jgi:hypothetical protein
VDVKSTTAPVENFFPAETVRLIAPESRLAAFAPKRHSDVSGRAGGPAPGVGALARPVQSSSCGAVTQSPGFPELGPGVVREVNLRGRDIRQVGDRLRRDHRTDRRHDERTLAATTSRNFVPISHTMSSTSLRITSDESLRRPRPTAAAATRNGPLICTNTATRGDQVDRKSA